MYQENLRTNSNRLWLNGLCLLLVSIAVFVSRNESLNSIALYAAIPISFICSFIYNENSLKTNKYLRIILTLYLWITFTILTAQDPKAAIGHVNPILGCVLLCVIVSNLAQNKKLVPWIYFVYSLLLVEAIIYVQNNILTFSYDISTARADDNKLNANTLSYYVFYATISLFIIRDIIDKNKLKKIFSLLFLAMIPVSFFVAVIAASRQVLVIQIPTFVMLFWIRYFRKARMITKIITISVVVIAFVVLNESVSNIYNNSYLSTRNESEYEEDIRVALIKEAFGIGCENPIFGLGPGGFARQQLYHMFSHCTYTELFANSGFPALAIYVYFLIYFMRRQLRRYKRYNDPVYLFFFTFGFVYSIYQFFYVFTADLWLISFFVFVTTHSELYNSQNHKLKITHKDRNVII